MPVPEPTYSLREVAELVGISYPTIQRYYAAELLPEPASRLGRHRRFTAKEARAVRSAVLRLSKESTGKVGRPLDIARD